MVLMLVSMEDVCALSVKQSGDPGHEAFLIGAIYEKNSAVVCDCCAGCRSHRSSDYLT